MRASASQRAYQQEDLTLRMRRPPEEYVSLLWQNEQEFRTYVNSFEENPMFSRLLDAKSATKPRGALAAKSETPAASTRDNVSATNNSKVPRAKSGSTTNSATKAARGAIQSEAANAQSAAKPATKTPRAAAKRSRS